ncbi:MAG: helix-turn-helix domain-containing protein [Methylococcaceae bacterium]|nr:helix-turn-helix domain-containing protein [Methylococcaceae bacterium]
MESIFQKVDCVNCKLSGVCLPYGLKRDDIPKLETIVKRKRPIKADEYLYRQEDQCTSLFVVKSGSFRSFIWNVNGGEQTIGFYLPGEIMGLDALRQQSKYHCTTIALETASVCEFPMARLNELCGKIPKLQMQLMCVIGSHIVSEQNNIVLLGNRSATEKVVTFLLMISSRYNALGYSSTEFNLTMPRHDIANFLGLTIETVSRQLGCLTKSGAITIKHRGVQINDMDKLKNIVEPCLTKRFTS